MSKNILAEEFVDLEGKSVRELKGIGRALQEYHKDVLKLHKMPMSSDCAQEIIDAEVMFRRAITNDFLTLIELNCAQCPMGFERNDCQAKSCPFKSVEKILKSRLDQLSQIRPGGV
jgi:hypothetical protein